MAGLRPQKRGTGFAGKQYDAFEAWLEQADKAQYLTQDQRDAWSPSGRRDPV